MIGIITSSMGIVLFLSGIVLKYTLINNLNFGIGIILSNLPDGLMPTLTINLAMAA